MVAGQFPGIYFLITIEYEAQITLLCQEMLFSPLLACVKDRNLALQPNERINNSLQG